MASEDPLPVDLGRLDEVTGGDREFTLELVELFLNDAQLTFDRIKAALQAGERDSLRREAHKLKGSAGNVGASTLAQAARELESSAPALDLPGLNELLGKLEQELRRVFAQLEQYVQVLKTPNN